MLKKYPKVTFDKEIAFRNTDAEFISFGHSLFEAMMVWIDNNFSDSLLKGATFIDPDGKMDGYILFYEGEIKDGTGDVAGKRLFSFYVCDEDVKSISPAAIWDMEEDYNANRQDANRQDANRQDACSTMETLKNRTLNCVIPKLEEYKKELLNGRNRQADIKQKYGIKSLEYLILKLDGDLISLYSRKEKGENVDLATRNKEERKEEYERAMKELKEGIEKGKSLTMGMPRFVGIIRVKPAEIVDRSMQSDKEIEHMGMQIAMEYETRHGREAENVSYENLGFDIRSKDKNGNVRYIEVKARADMGAVALTTNEWFKANRFKDDYYLYVVMNAAKEPQLYIIQNPAEHLEPEKRVEVVRYVVSFKEIIAKGKK